MNEDKIEYGSMRIYTYRRSIDILRTKQNDMEFWKKIAELIENNSL